MTIEFNVFWYDGCDCRRKSKVYAIDTVRERFLIADKNGKFKWVSIDECEREL